MFPDKKHTSLVVSPLKALINDQVNSLTMQGIRACSILQETMIQDIQNEDFHIIFISPESATLPKWRKVLKHSFRNKICMLAFDEAHCISTWGFDFRPQYRRISTLQSLVDVPNLVLTATATAKIQLDLYDVSGLSSNTKVVATLPDRKNIFINFLEKELSWIPEHLNGGTKIIIIYVNSINLCYHIFWWIVTVLMEVNPQLTRHVDMYHASVHPDTKERILKEFSTTQATIKVLISTIAFDMGINIPNVDIVVNWGMPSSSRLYWQEVGRCARDGRNGYAICYAYKRTINKCEDAELKGCLLQTTCLRKQILSVYCIP